MEHFRADVTENSYSIEGRSKCFTGVLALENAKGWLSEEIERDCQHYGKSQDESYAMTHEVSLYDGTWEAVEVTMEIPGNRSGYMVIMGYRITSIDGACEGTC